MSVAESNGEANGEVKRDPRLINVEYEGDRFVIPKDMDIPEAREALHLIQEEQYKNVAINEEVRAFPLEGAVALQKVLKRRFGWVNTQSVKTMFGNHPPRMFGVEVDFNVTEQVPWGRCGVPKIDGYLETGVSLKDGLPVFCLGGEVKRKDEHVVREIAAEIRKIVQEESIYKGKAIKINFRDGDGDRIADFHPLFAPKFMDMDSSKTKEIVYAEETERMIRTNVFNPVKHSDKCRQEGVPLKRGVLLEGPYGTGKTLTAHLLASLCVQNGWTFLYLQDVRDLDIAMGFAKLYGPCVLFAEDVDRAVSGMRSDEMNQILNTLDGVESKNDEIMTVLTTNNKDAIHRGFVRPGRIDTVISVLPPDLKAMVRLVRQYGRDSEGNCIIEGTDEELQESVKELKNSNASFVREAVERAKLSAIGNDGPLRIKPSDISIAIASMKGHMEMVCPGSGRNPEEVEEVDPTQFAFQILTQKFTESFVNCLSNPKVIQKVIKQGVKKGNGYGANPSRN